MTALLRLVSDLTRDGKVQQAFASDPHPLMDEYGLDEEAQAVLFSMDPQLIASCIQRELTDYDVAYSGIKWPGPHPEVRAFEPSIAPSGGRLAFKVRGEGFIRAARLSLVGRDSEGKEQVVAARGVDVSGGYREALLCAELDLTGVPAGNYTVTVDNGYGTRALKSFFPFVVEG